MLKSVPLYLVCFLAFYFLSSLTPVLAADAVWELIWNKKTETLSAEVCFNNLPVMILSNHDRELSTALSSATQKSRNSKARRNQIRFDPALSDCLSYQVSLKTRGRYPYVFEEDNLVLPTHIWFWRHEQIKTARFSFKDANGNNLKFYLPWPEQDGEWNLSVTPPGWTSRTLIGKVQHYPIQLTQDRQINAVLLGNLNSKSRRWLTWLQETANAVEKGFGYFPVDQANILVMPASSRNSPVPWGEVQRGGYPAVHLFIDASKSLDEFRQDWTASHEMSHLFVPKTSWRDRWLSEGIASYYQNLVRSRAGILSEEQAWQKLRQGFARGRRDFNHRSLRNNNKIMHLYWGGVSIYFLADLRLREKGSSLDAVLQAFNSCCFTLNKTWSAEELMAKFDAISKTSIFTALLQNEAITLKFPIPEAFEQSDNPLLQKHLKYILTGK